MTDKYKCEECGCDMGDEDDSGVCDDCYYESKEFEEDDEEDEE